MPDTKQDLSKEIRDAASMPKSYENDGEKITNHSMRDLIEADKYIAKKRIARNPFAAVRIAKIITEGAGR